MKMKRTLPLADLRISKKAKEYVNLVLDSNRLTYGPMTKKFEVEFAKIHKRKFAIFTNSGSSALLVSLLALKEHYKWQDYDEVIVPALTFISSANVILQANLTPVFVDIEKDYYCIDPQKIEEKITKKTKAIMPVHLFGQSSDMNALLKIAKKHKLKILEDSCETMFVSYDKKPVGSLGDISVYSTYTAHILVTGVGGIITTNNLKLAEIIKSLIFHGRNNVYLNIDDDNTSNPAKLKTMINKRFEFNRIGYSLRLTEMEAALGLAELERKNHTIIMKKRAGNLLNSVFEKFPQSFIIPKVRPKAEHIYMLYPVIIKSPKIKRNDLLLHLEKNGIETRLFFPLLSQPIYKKLFKSKKEKYPASEYLVKNGFIIGANPYFSDSDAEYLRNILESYFKKEELKVI